MTTKRGRLACLSDARDHRRMVLNQSQREFVSQIRHTTSNSTFGTETSAPQPARPAGFPHSTSRCRTGIVVNGAVVIRAHIDTRLYRQYGHGCQSMNFFGRRLFLEHSSYFVAARVCEGDYVMASAFDLADVTAPRTSRLSRIAGGLVPTPVASGQLQRVNGFTRHRSQQM